MQGVGAELMATVLRLAVAHLLAAEDYGIAGNSSCIRAVMLHKRLYLTGAFRALSSLCIMVGDATLQFFSAWSCWAGRADGGRWVPFSLYIWALAQVGT